MSITRRTSVLVLGAGVSEPFGIPLGGQLVDLIANQIDEESSEAVSDHYGGKAFDASIVVNWTEPARWHRHPIFGTIMRQRMNGNTLPTKEAYEAFLEIQALRELLRNQTAETIDSFIAENPKSAPLAKLALAALLLRSSYTPGRENHGEPLSIKPFAARTLKCQHRRNDLPQTERNWVHLLINIIRHGIDSGSVSSNDTIKIVTFNYDTILEHVLETQFANRESPLGPFSNYVEILHVHGQVGKLAPACMNPSEIAFEWSKGISVVKEATPPPEVLAARERARSLIAEAEHVYAVGFAFAGPNCRLLGLNSQPATHNRLLTYCNYDGNRGIKEAARLYASRTEEVPGEWSRPLSVTDFIRAGYLGEPPS